LTRNTRLPALLVALSIAAAGFTWGGCGGADETATGNDAQERIERGAKEAREEIEKGKEEARRHIEKNRSEAEQRLEKGKSEAKKAIEEAERQTGENKP